MENPSACKIINTPVMMIAARSSLPDGTRRGLIHRLGSIVAFYDVFFDVANEAHREPRQQRDDGDLPGGFDQLEQLIVRIVAEDLGSPKDPEYQDEPADRLARSVEKRIVIEVLGFRELASEPAN